MKCFYHHDVDAVAICKSCSRALCSACAVDVHPGTACMNRCEKDVDALNIVIERSKSAYQKTGRAYKRSAVATLVAGLVFFALGILPIVMNGKYDAVLMAILGLVLILWAYFSYKSGKQIESREGNP